MQIIFQDPFSSLDPRKTVGEAIEEPLLINRIIKSRQERLSKVRDIMEVVGLSQRLINTYPHELDGGRRQRIGIARALIFKPKFIICDEPVSALDVSIQAQIINLLQELQEEFDLTYVFITHDLSVVNYISDDIAVMYLGKIVEMASSEVFWQTYASIYKSFNFSDTCSRYQEEARYDGTERRDYFSNQPRKSVQIC